MPEPAFIDEEELATSSARIVRALLLQLEELEPNRTTASPEGLVASVFAELAQAAQVFNTYLGESDEGELFEDEPGDLLIGRFARVATLAMDAAARIDPSAREIPTLQVKDALLRELDEQTEAWLEEDAGPYPDQAALWLGGVTALLFGAASSLAIRHGLPVDYDPDKEWDDDEEERPYWWPEGDSPEEAMATSLLQAAGCAMGAVEWFQEDAIRRREAGI